MGIEKLEGVNLGSIINKDESLILFIGMYGCEPCELFESRIDKLSNYIQSPSTLKYIKLRPSQFRLLQDRSVIDAVPVIISFRHGREYKRFEGLPGHGPFSEYAEKINDLIAAVA